MRKLFAFDLVSLDGYFEGPHREIDWHHVDAEFNDYAIAMLDSLGTLLFGRITYELMAKYWPSPEAIKNDPAVAERMNALPKVVFSRTLEKADWNNTRLVRTDAADEVSKIKNQPGKDIALFGSSDLTASLVPHDLIDEYRIMVNPVFLGEGRPFLKGIRQRLNLKLIGSRTFRNGNVLLTYEPAR